MRAFVDIIILEIGRFAHMSKSVKNACEIETKRWKNVF